jgi:predicted cupin superfamily sugar epimerase
MSDSPVPQRIAELLGMTALDVEGGLWSQSWRGQECSAIYYLLVAPDYSALHRLDRLEIYSYHAGSPARLLLIDGEAVSEPVLGPDVAAGQRPQIVVPAGVWQGSAPLGEWTLMGTVVVPPYTDDCEEFADTEALSARHPEHADRIRSLSPLGGRSVSG